jgi:NAD(P)H-hydrate epimerase
MMFRGWRTSWCTSINRCFPFAREHFTRDIPHMKLVTAKQMQAIDAEAIGNRGIPGLTLMENAGRGIAEHIRSLLIGDVTNKRFAIVCGKGNNGGDGFVIGRYVHSWGAHVEFFLLGRVADLEGDAATNCKRAADINLPIVEVSSEANLPDLSTYDMIVDAIFGTGFRGAVSGIASTCISRMNASGKTIVAVDSPSGLDSDSGLVSGECVRATHTATLALPKLGQFIYPGREYVGRLVVIDIGIPTEVIESASVSTYLITEQYVRDHLPRRFPTANKGSCGKLYVLAGSRGYTGAASMAAESALRSGVGLCYLGVPETLNPIFEIKLTEAITRPLPEVGKKQCLALRGLGEIRKHLKDIDAAIIGPGLGTHHETKELVRRLISSLEMPSVIDADGLNAFQGASEEIAKSRAPLVLTPHPGELSRLIDHNTAEIAADRLGFAKTSSARFGCVVLLKGAPTFVADPSGRIFVNPTGNSGMATGGSGDVLSGIIGALLAQKLPPLDAACCGAYIHGLAGDLAADEHGQTAMLPTDMIANLPAVYCSLGF